MKIYTIGVESHETYGHGDFGTETQIHTLGAYGTGEFPPCFTKRWSAEQWLKNAKQDRVLYCGGETVVELELVL